MKCTEFEKLVDEYVDGELSHSLTEVEEHLRTCDACQQLYKETLELKQLLNGLEEVDLPEDFELSLHEKLVAVSEENKVLPFYRRTKTIKAITSVAAIAVVSILAFRAGTMMPTNDDNMLYGSIDVSSNEAMKEEAMPEMAMNMDMADNAAMDDGEVYDMAEEEAVEETMTAFTVNDVPLAKSIRMEMDNDIYTSESVNYWMAVDTELDRLNEFVMLYDVSDFEIDESYRYTFYLNKEDFDVFSENMLNNFEVTNEFVLEFTAGLEDIQIQFSDQQKIVNNLTRQTDEDTDQESLEVEQRLLDDLSEEVNKINDYKDRIQITITINKE